MKVGDLIRWVLEDHELGVIVEVYKAEEIVLTAYKVYCLADNRFYNVYHKEIEVINENR